MTIMTKPNIRYLIQRSLNKHD